MIDVIVISLSVVFGLIVLLGGVMLIHYAMVVPIHQPRSEQRMRLALKLWVGGAIGYVGAALIDVLGGHGVLGSITWAPSIFSVAVFVVFPVFFFKLYRRRDQATSKIPEEC